MIKKFPFAIVAGVCAMVAFYGILGFVGANILLNSIAAQTSDTVSMFGNWWQVLLFVVDIISVLGCIAMAVLAVIQKKKYPAAEEEEDF